MPNIAIIRSAIKRWLIPLIILITIFLIPFPFNSGSTTSSLVKCSQEKCIFNKIGNLEKTQRQSQDIDFYIKSMSCANTPEWAPLGRKSIWLKSSSDGTSINFPVLFPNDGKTIGMFSIAIPKILGSCNIDFQVIKSREYILKVNGFLVRSQKYDSPVFGIGTVASNVSNPGTESFIEFGYGKKTNGVPAVYNLFFILSIIGLALFAVRRASGDKIVSSSIDREKFQISDINIFMIETLTLYAIALIKWALMWTPNKDVVNWARDTPFNQAGPRYSDFFEIFLGASNHNPFQYSAVNYPPSALMILKPFTILGGMKSFVVLVAISIALILHVFTNCLNSIPKTLSFWIVLLNFPILFAFDRGNLDIFAIALTLVALTIRDSRTILAGLLIGIAICLKLWPILFLVIFIKRRAYRRLIVVAVSMFTCLTVFADKFFHGTPLLALKTNTLSAGAGYIAHNVSLPNVIGLVLSLFKTHDPSTVARFSQSLVAIVTTYSLGAVCLIVSILSRRFFTAIYSISLFVILVPQVTFYYRLGAMLVPFYFYLQGERHKYSRVKQNLIALCWGLLFAPVAFYYVPASAVGTDTIFPTLSICALTLLLFAKELKTVFSNGYMNNVTRAIRNWERTPKI